MLIALMIASIGSGLLILVLSLTALHFGSVDALFGFKPSEISAELSAFIMTFAVLLAASFPINAMGQAMRGLQKAWIFNCSRMTGYIAATFGVWLGQSMSASLMTLLLLSFGLQLLCNAIVGCGVLIWQTRHAGQLRLSRIRRFIGRMLSTGGSYVLFNLARTFGWLLDYVLVIRLIGPEAAAGLAIIQRMYQVVTIGYSILSSALWPVYAYLISGHEWRRLRTLFLAGFSATVGYAVLASMLLFTFREEIAQVWLHNSVLSLTTAYGLFAIWYCVEAAGSSFSVLLNAKGIVTRQATAAVVFASVSFALKLWFVPLYGLTGLVSSTLAGYAVGFVTLLLLIRKIPLFRGR
ncbi:lipopolysaccharide biosynthesis protein [Bosea vaviloviae]|uniref:lipopolysaccharide biosynthesis protein n=1 Tax=Bosea vaviloviae TaxID=1526658 RepID=UPI0018D08651|nr:MATE family efflux transporter [Bosea vaviloviae]